MLVEATQSKKNQISPKDIRIENISNPISLVGPVSPLFLLNSLSPDSLTGYDNQLQDVRKEGPECVES